jgi:DNA-directed RNA polymerase subunit RPC12/RpoP
VSVGASVEQYEGTLRLPHLPALNHFYGTTTVADDVRAELHLRLGVITASNDEHLVLRPVQRVALISHIFELATITAKQSASGRRARQIVLQLGDIQRCRVFRLPGVRELLKQREAHTGLLLSRAVEFIRDGFAEAEPFYVSGEHLDDPQEVFRFLLRQRVFLAAHELVCPNCGITSMHAARELDDEVRCPQCGHVFLLAPTLTLRGNQWRYRLTGLLAQPEQHVLPEDRPDRPTEAVSVLLTAAWLHDASALNGLLLDTNYTLRGDDLDGEVDLVGVQTGQRGKVSVLVGECRTENRLTEDDVSKMERIASCLRGAGLDCYPLFAVLRDSLSDEEVALFCALRDCERYGDHLNPRPPIILMRADLERGDFARRERGS